MERSRYTPKATPTYKYNSWMKDGHKIVYTPRENSSNAGTFPMFGGINVTITAIMVLVLWKH